MKSRIWLVGLISLIGLVGGVFVIRVIVNAAAGPVAFWHFDDGTGTTAQDSTTNNNDGTITGATWQTEDMCVSGKCLWFDGSNDVVSAGDINLLDGLSAFTVNLWFKQDAVTSDKALVTKWDHATQDVFAIQRGANSEIETFIASSLTDAGSNTCSTSGFNTQANTWYFLTVVYDGSQADNYTRFKVFKNGVKQNISCAGTIPASLASGTSNLRIGQFGGTLTRNFNGFIDEPKIYNYARSADQIKLDYNNSGINKGAGTRLGSDPRNAYSALSNGLVGYWKMDESSGNAADSSGNGVTLTNNATITYVAGKFGNGSEHVPASSQYLSTATTISGVKTVSFWTNPDSTTNYFVSLTSGAYVTASSGVLSATGFTSPKIYVNGVAAATIVADSWQLVTVTTETGIDANQFYVGRQGSNYYDGTMDEVRIYNRALSSSEVSTLYNFAPGPVGYWQMEEGSGTTINDSSGNGKTSSAFTGNVAWTSGKYGKGLVFDGTDDVVRFTEAAQFDLGATTDSYTVQAWYKTSASCPAAKTLIVTKNDGSGAWPYEIKLNDTCQVDFQIYDGTNFSNAASGNAMNDGQWHFITGVRDVATDKVYVYNDGRLIASATDTTTATTANNDDLSIGNGGASYTTNDFNGSIDEAKIYNYARTQKQIVEDMNAGHPAPGSPVGSAVGHWKFDEGYGTTANNSGTSGSSANGTLSTFASPATVTSGWTNNGKFGKALAFDGSSDEIQLNTTSLDPGTGNFSVSAWFKTSQTTEGIIVSRDSPGGTTAFGLRLGLPSSGTVGCRVSNSTQVSSSGTYNDNGWHYVVCSVTRSGSAVLYVDGVQVASGSVSGSSSNSISGGAWRIGDEAFPAYFFNGYIDEVKMYHFPLTAEEVKIDYNRGQAINFGVLGASITDGKTASNSAATAYCVPGDTSTCNPPVVHYTFEEGAGSTVNDISGNNNSGAWSGSGSPRYASGKIGKTGRFDGSTDYVEKSSPNNITSNQSGTIEFWAYLRTNVPDDKAVISVQDRDTDQQNQIYISLANTTNRLDFVVFKAGVFTNYILSGTPVYALNTWNHYAFTSNGSTYKLYINGVSKNLTANTGLNDGQWFGDLTGPDSLSIGARINTLAATLPFPGSIDEVKVFDYARTPSQIAYDYNRGLPLAHWKFDECQGTTANDSSGNSNTGTITIGASGTQTTVGTCTGSANQAWKDGVNGKFNYSLDFDGTDDYVTMGNTLSQDGTTPFSMSAWVKLTDDATTQIIMGKSAGSGNFEGYILYKGDDSDTARFYFRSTAPSNFGISSPAIIADSTWHHVAATYDGSLNVSGMKVYVDGRLVATGASQAISGTLTTTAPFSIGSRGGTSQFSVGQIDELKVFNYPLTDYQVRTEFNQGSAVRFGPVTGSP